MTTSLLSMGRIMASTMNSDLNSLGYSIAARVLHRTLGQNVKLSKSVNRALTQWLLRTSVRRTPDCGPGSHGACVNSLPHPQDEAGAPGEGLKLRSRGGSTGGSAICRGCCRASRLQRVHVSKRLRRESGVGRIHIPPRLSRLMMAASPWLTASQDQISSIV